MDAAGTVIPLEKKPGSPDEFRVVKNPPTTASPSPLDSENIYEDAEGGYRVSSGAQVVPLRRETYGGGGSVDDVKADQEGEDEGLMEIFELEDGTFVDVAGKACDATGRLIDKETGHYIDAGRREQFDMLSLSCDSALASFVCVS